MSTFREATEADIPQIMAIIRAAQAYLAAQGIDQWQDGYPDETVVRGDIASGNGYVLAEGDRVQGIAAVIFDGEPTYDVIHDGAWTTPEPFACVHRIAVDAALRGQGIADALMQGAEALIQARGFSSVRIDTHHDNIVMQRMLGRNGYTPCGTIFLESGAPRIALEKSL